MISCPQYCNTLFLSIGNERYRYQRVLILPWLMYWNLNSNIKKNNRHIQQWLIALLEYRESNCLCVKYEMDKTVVLTQWCLTGLWSILNARNTYVCWWQPTELDEIGIPVLTYTCPPISQGATFDGYLINHTL